MDADHSLVVRHEPEPLSGAENMRIDAELLGQAVESGHSTLRFYQWSEPTVSLGYFQRDRAAIPPDLTALPVVPRLSGGGAILHDNELTYSIALAAHEPAAKNASALYGVVHKAIIDVLTELGVECRMRGDRDSDPGNLSFLCFSRSDPNDIVVGGAKIVGSAQRRRRGAVLQHGSILLGASPYASEVLGLAEFGCEVDPSDLAGKLDHSIRGRLAASG